ncbi:MAG: hypothetical protein JXQ73_28075 [Phycisphaerae bacterium]|nr:hypothetical protein [Phycisphaerae bacterium]
MANMKAIHKAFQEPDALYRGKPFWAWNGKLEEAELRRQLRIMHEMGLGGAFMHSRVGLATPYLSNEWFDLIEACADECAKLGMEAWLYDEDRWPSGAAGGIVTKDPKYRMRRLKCELADAKSFNAKGKSVLALFAARLDGDKAFDVRKITPAGLKKLPEGQIGMVFHVALMPDSSWYNGYTYLDTMSHEAVRKFIQVTHQRYRAKNGKHFGKTIPGIFTDEPNHGWPQSPEIPRKPGDEMDLAWTPKLPQIFKKRYGYDLIAHLPELFFDVDGAEVSQARWHYHDCTTYLFVDAFARQIGEWCEKNKLMHTGHVLEEPRPSSQVNVVGSAMRFYEHMQAPGIDILTEPNDEFDTAKQCASALNQTGRKWMLSELYGCTGWQFNFESHKAVGDWQAALGVNLRCQHLSFYTMAGEAKRDYPASIFYQSPWWRHYAEVEDYFARVNVLMTRGRPVRDVLVVHPIESTWVRSRAGYRQAKDVLKLDADLAKLRNWLLDSQIDFDYGDEEMLSRLAKVVKSKQAPPALRVGKATYQVVVVPPMLTVRSSTLTLLRKFHEAGGTVVFAGPAPRHVDAITDAAAAELARECTSVPFAGAALVGAVEPAGRTIRITGGDGKNLAPVIYMLRSERDAQYLFVVNRDRKRGHNLVHIQVQGAAAEEWDPVTGERHRTETIMDGGAMTIITSLPPVGSRLFVIRSDSNNDLPLRRGHMEVARTPLGGKWSYHLDEPNVFVLDKAQYRLRDDHWHGPTEILKVDQAVRDALELPRRGGAMVQPWARPPKSEEPTPLALRYVVQIDELPPGPIWLAVETPERFAITVNGQSVSSDADDGWWTDRSIRRLPIDPALLRVGVNEIEMHVDFVEGDNLEASFLLGAFGVKLDASVLRATVTAIPAKLHAGDWCKQGLPFYAGSVTYRRQIKIMRQAEERVFVVLPKYAGGVVRVLVDGRPAGYVKWQPYELDITDAIQGDVIDLGIEVIGHRHNAFGPLHQAPPEPPWTGPGNFITEGEQWQEAYNLYPCGLLAPPVLSIRS